MYMVAFIDDYNTAHIAASVHAYNIGKIDAFVFAYKTASYTFTMPIINARYTDAYAHEYNTG
jgi:hypothetical protein